MDLLLIEDDEGLREGLASFLRLKGHRVRVAPSLAAGRQALAAEPTLDAVLTDWHLGDGMAADLDAPAGMPVLVMSGYPDDVPQRATWTVLRKPVALPELLHRLEELSPTGPEAPRRAGPCDAAPDPIPAGLPVDLRDRVRLALALLDQPADVEMLDDGNSITLRCRVDDPAAALRRLAVLGGDGRQVVAGGTPGLELRLARRAGGAVHVGLDDGWPDGTRPVVVDLDGVDERRVGDLDVLLARVGRARDAGRAVTVVNLPAAWRLWLELQGRGDEVPMRTVAGPRLSEALAELWS